MWQIWFEVRFEWAALQLMPVFRTEMDHIKIRKPTVVAYALSLFFKKAQVKSTGCNFSKNNRKKNGLVKNILFKRNLIPQACVFLLQGFSLIEFVLSD